MPTTTILVVTGEQLEVEGSIDHVVKKLEDAARSSAGTFALLSEAGSDRPLGVNAAQVVTVRPAGE